MPDKISIEYGENVTPKEMQQLNALEQSVRAALGHHSILGRMRWVAKCDQSRHTLFALEHVTDGSPMLTYYAAHELSNVSADDVDKHIFGGRHRYPEPLSDRPFIFEGLSTTQRGNVVNFRRDITILVPRPVTKLGNISGISRSRLMPTHVEVPPSPVALTDEATVQIMVHAPPGLEGAWQQLFIATYHAGGRIYFRDFDADTIEAVFRFH